MRLIFFGSGAFGLPTLQRLAAEHEVVAVVSQPDKPAGRKRTLTPTPIAQYALEQGIPLHRVEDVNTPAFVEQVAEMAPEASVVIAFGQKLSPELIEAMGRLAVNLHASLLPKYRGAAPINRAMMAGETETGVCVIALAQKMDAGVIYGQASTPIDARETAGELHDRLADLGPDVVGQVLANLAAGTLRPQEQDESQATQAPKLRKEDGTVDFAQPAQQVRAQVHGLTPWPGCRVSWEGGDGKTQPLILVRVMVEAGEPGGAPGTVVDDHGGVAATDGVVRLLELQVPGKRVMDYGTFVHGRALRPGDRLLPWTG